MSVQVWTLEAENMEEKKLKTMNDISALDAWILFRGYLKEDQDDINPPSEPTFLFGFSYATDEERVQKHRESWERSDAYVAMLKDIAARDFLECLKMFTDSLRDSPLKYFAPLPDFLISDHQRQELSDIPDEKMRKLLSEAEYQVIRGLMDGKTIKEIAFERSTSPKTIAAQKNSALMKLTAAGYKVTVPKELTPWNEELS
jgi:DNA-binding CsgD family transcriptional regulator